MFEEVEKEIFWLELVLLGSLLFELILLSFQYDWKIFGYAVGVSIMTYITTLYIERKKNSNVKEQVNVNEETI